MKKFFKLVAVVLAIAVIICPMMIFAETSTSSGTYKIALVDANTVQLTINSTDGFVAYHAIVGFNKDDAFQSSYNDDGYVDGLKVISYTLKTEQANDHNKPTIRAHASGTSLNVIVMPSDTNNLDLCTKIVIGIRVASGATASLTKIQAADNGTVDSDNANLLTFPAAGSDGVIDTASGDYKPENATTAHTHNLTLVPANDPTCTVDGNYAYYTCSCGKIFSDSEGTDETTLEAVTIPATGHSFTNYVSDGNATCTADGTKTAKCDNCDETDTVADTGSALGHSFTNYVSNNDATCTQDGTKTAACDHKCGTTKTITDEGSALGHNMIHHDAASSTCLVQGNIEYYSCSRCKKLFANESGATELTAEQIKTALAAHTPSKAVVENDVASTCTTAGHYQKVVYCSVCGVELSRDTYNKELKAHSYGEWTTNADGHSRTCSDCGAVDSGEHDGSPCTVCGYEAATGPVFDASLSAAFTKKVLAISDTFKSETTVLLKNFPANYSFDSFVVTKKILTAPSYTYTSDVAEYVFGTETCTNAKNRAYKITFSNVGLYELGTKLEYKLLVNEGGTLCYYSWEESIVDLAVEYYEGRSTLTPTKAGKDLIADVLKVAETARLYFANVAANAGYTNNSLAEMPVLNSAIDYENYGTKDYGELPDPVSKPTGVTKAVLSLLSSPSFGITMLAPNKADRASWTPESVTVTCSYFSKAENKQITEEMLGTDPDTSKIEVKSTGAVVLTYSGVKLYDADKAVTITATNGTTEYTYTASILSMISPMIDNVGLDGDVYRAIACFNASAHAFWPTY